MKRAVPVLVLLAILTGCGPSAKELATQQRRKERAELVKAYCQIKDWEAECTITHGGKKRVNVPKIFKLYSTLDVSRCPEPFRLAWFDYQTAIQKHQHEANVAFLEVAASVATGGVTGVALVGKAVNSADRAMKDDPALAVRAVKRFWVEYNIGPADLK